MSVRSTQKMLRVAYSCYCGELAHGVKGKKNIRIVNLLISYKETLWRDLPKLERKEKKNKLGEAFCN